MILKYQVSFWDELPQRNKKPIIYNKFLLYRKISNSKCGKGDRLKNSLSCEP